MDEQSTQSGRHRRARLSLPSIRISSPAGLQSLRRREGGEVRSRDYHVSSNIPDVEHDESSSPSPLPNGAGIDPVLPESLRQGIQKSMHNCQEYERKCALLEHNIEHKILLWSDILDQYEMQDSTATQLRESIAASLSALQSAQSTIASASSSTLIASNKLDRSQTLLENVNDSIQASTQVMCRLDVFMTGEEVTAQKVERLQRGLLGSVTCVTLVLAVLGAWVYSQRHG